MGMKMRSRSRSGIHGSGNTIRRHLNHVFVATFNVIHRRLCIVGRMGVSSQPEITGAGHVG